MNKTPFLAVEGPIGVGKTTLAEKLSAHYQFHLLKEGFEENPFLTNFYQDMDAWSFQTEMFFLNHRYQQLENMKHTYIEKQKPVVADYHIFKSFIFANRTLPADKFDKYKRIYHILTEDLAFPNIVIYLYARKETLIERVNRRGRVMEQQMKPSYLAELSLDYENFIDQFEQNHSEIPVIRINGDDKDFVQNQQDFKHIVQRINDHLYKGNMS